MTGLLLVGLLGSPAAVRADDVNEKVRAAYTAGSNLFREGGRGNLEKAFRLLNTRKDEALDSVDYWELYARVWLALDKVPRYLWVNTIGPRQEKAPASPVFDLVRARVEQDPKAQRTYIDAALKRKPDSLRAKAMLALLLLDDKKEAEADRLMEEVLEADPFNARCLVGKARLALSDGMAQDALELIDKALTKDDGAFLFHLKSLAYRRLAQGSEEEGLLEKALAAATEALGRDPSPEHVKNYDELLQETGDAAAAAKALRGHFERTKLPLLGALLAKSAFRAGDYEAAVLGLSAAEEPDLPVLKALAVAYARMGKAKDARKVTKQILKLDSGGVLFAAEVELRLGDAKAAEKQLGSLTDIEAKKLLVRIHAWNGKPKAITELLASEARKGTRRGEDVLLSYLQAQVVESMGKSSAEKLRKKMIAARKKAGGKATPQADSGGGDLGTIKTEGWGRRAVTYWRAPCGRFYKPAGDGFNVTIHLEGDKPSISQSVEAKAGCAHRHTTSFHFNKRTSKEGLTPEALLGLLRGAAELGNFKPAEEAFAAGCSACVSGKGGEAIEKFDAALKIEPGWHRAQIYRAVMQALEGKADKGTAASDAAKAVEAWPTDFEARRLVLFLRAWGGDGKLSEEIDALAEAEARYNERDLEAL